MRERILEAIKELRKSSKKRNFVQSFDLIISLKDYDVRRAENKFVEDVVLPHGRGEDAKVVVFSDVIKNLNCEVLTSKEIEFYSKNKREAKKLVKETDFFLSEPSLMVLVGKTFGQFMGTKGKMPKVISGDVNKMVENYKKTTRIKVKDAPVIQCLVGKENMKDEEIAENIEAVLKAVQTRLPKGKQNIKEILLKLTMSKPIKIGV